MDLSVVAGTSSAQVTPALPGSEDFETFPTGTLPVNSWDADFEPDFAIVSTTTIQGTRSWRHTGDGSDFPDTGFSPTFTPYYGFLASSVRMNGDGTDTNQWIPLGDTPATGGGTYFNTRVQFTPGGTIEALQVVAGNGVFAPTTGTWAPGQTLQMASETRADGSLRLYENGNLIFTGTELGFALTGIAGHTMEWYSFHDDLTAGNTMTVDSFTNAVPEPVSAGLLVLAGAGMLRRSRW